MGKRWKILNHNFLTLICLFFLTKEKAAACLLDGFSIDTSSLFYYNVCNEMWVFRNLFHKFGW